MTEQKIRANDFNLNISIGVVGYGTLKALHEMEEFFGLLDGFHVVYIKTSSQKLWIKEGEK